MDKPTPVALTIAGSDSGGGAGIQADLKTFHAFQVFGCSAVTAVTAQNTIGIDAIHTIPDTVVRAQIDAVATDLLPLAVKTGMLANANLVYTVAERIRHHSLKNYILDPVMVSSTGDQILDEEAVEVMRKELIPLATMVTPNIHEASILTQKTLEHIDDFEVAGRELLKMGAQAALIKGGHLEGSEAVDLLLTDQGCRVWSRPRLNIRAGHGTGCTLSAAIAAGLALGQTLLNATDAGVNFVAQALASALDLGTGYSPINHFNSAFTKK